MIDAIADYSYRPAALIGILTGAACSSLQNVNEWLHIDEGLYVFKLHGIGGIIGSFLTGIFADSAISALDGSLLAPGAWNGEGIQVGRQLADICAISLWSFCISFILLFAMKYIPGLHLRVSEEVEAKGLDSDQFFDEQIGDWSFFDETHGGPAKDTPGTTKDGLAISSENSMDRDNGAAPVPAAKRE